MKQNISRLSHRRSYSFFQVLLLLKRKLGVILLIPILIFLLAGCFNKFYSAKTTTRIDSMGIEKLKAANKYFIIHYQDSVLGLSGISIDNNVLIGKREQLAPEHSTQLNPQQSTSNIFKKENKDAVLSEVHLYVNDKATTVEYPEVKVPLYNFYKMNVYEFDNARTNKSTTGSIFGIVGILAITFGIIVIAVWASQGAYHFF
jgi:hypothetical protein